MNIQQPVKHYAANKFIYYFVSRHAAERRHFKNNWVWNYKEAMWSIIMKNVIQMESEWLAYGLNGLTSGFVCRGMFMWEHIDNLITMVGVVYLILIEKKNSVILCFLPVYHLNHATRILHYKIALWIVENFVFSLLCTRSQIFWEIFALIKWFKTSVRLTFVQLSLTSFTPFVWDSFAGRENR